jgi:expansin (peptidoglycan-binding protein)
MCTGNLVFKVKTYSQDWWHAIIKPWEHYVPVKEDLSDLYEKYQWVESHPEEVKKIIDAGTAICEETLREEYVMNYTQNVLNELTPISGELINEANAILDQRNGLNLLLKKYREDAEKNSNSEPKPEPEPESEKKSDATADNGEDVAYCSQNIKQYLECSQAEPGHLLMLKWDKNGDLDRRAMEKTFDNAIFKEWFGYAENHIKKGKPNYVALFYDTDHSYALNYTVTPPVPMLSFTLKNEAKKENNYFLLANPYDSGGYNRACIDEIEKQVNKPFSMRENRIIWRGVLHGNHEVSRVNLIELGKNETNKDWLDGKATEWLRIEMKMEDQALYKYHLDIGGVSGTAWGGLRWKMCSGNLVFKVDTWSRDWWHEMIEPWKHYIPVKEDLRDLHDMFLWAENHPDEVNQIVTEGTKLCTNTVTDEFILKFTEQLLNELPPLSDQLIQEADALLSERDGPNLLTSSQ